MDERLYTKEEVRRAIRKAFEREQANLDEVLRAERVSGLPALIGALEYGEAVALHAVDLLGKQSPSPQTEI